MVFLLFIYRYLCFFCLFTCHGGVGIGKEEATKRYQGLFAVFSHGGYETFYQCHITNNERRNLSKSYLLCCSVSFVL